MRNGVAVLLNLGHRWIMKDNFYMGLGIFGGVSNDLKNQGTYTGPLHDGEIEGDYAKTRAVGIIEFSLGWSL